MNRKLYVGNLGFQVTEEEVQELFGACGEVQEVKLITDRETGRSRGFCFVTMTTPEAASKAIKDLDGKPFQERNLIVNMARDEKRDGPRESRGPGGPRGSFRR